MNPEHLHRSELIGLKARVVASSNQDVLSLSGKIIDETKNTFTIEDSKHNRKKILKNGTVLRVESERQEYDIHCSKLMKRPHERIKK